MTDKVVGSILAVFSNGTDRTRKVRPFTVAADTPWVDIVDEAIERTWGDVSGIEWHEDDIDVVSA